MNTTNDMNMQEKQRRLNTIITQLSTESLTNELTGAFVDKFDEIYSDGFRHSYSSITGVLLQLHKDNKSIQSILENLDMINEVLICDETKQGFNKLYDHISLETIRIDELYNSYQEKLNEANEALAGVTVISQSLKAHGDKLEAEASRLKTDVITILSIFAAIVLTFMGGMSFSASILTGMAEISPYRLIFIMAICGIIIFDTIAMLLYLVTRIINKSVAVKCKTEDCSCENKCRIIKVLRKRYPLVFWFNLLMIAFMTVDTTAWIIVN